MQALERRISPCGPSPYEGASEHDGLVIAVALAVGTLLLVWWLVAAASGPKAFATVQVFIGSILGRLLLFGWTLALFYHLCNGIRHLVWDAGYGFELDVAYRSGLAVLAASVALTLISWILGYSLAAA